jgi:hypothetical protein
LRALYTRYFVTSLRMSKFGEFKGENMGHVM